MSTTLPFRVVASDLDGSLFGSDREVSERTIAVLRVLAGSGVEIIAATGRSHWTAVPRLAPVGVFRWAICSNGSSVYDFDSAAIVERSVLSNEACEAVADLPRRLPGVGLGWEHAGGLERDAALLGQHARHSGRVQFEEPAIPFDQFIGNDRSAVGSLEAGVNKMLVGHDTLQHDDLLAAIVPLLPPELEVSSSGAHFLEVTSPGTEKGATLARVVEGLGLGSSDVVAFGDQQNDLGMLRWAGLGFAMATAHPRTIEAADRRAGDHDADGVAEALMDLFGITL